MDMWIISSLLCVPVTPQYDLAIRVYSTRGLKNFQGRKMHFHITPVFHYKSDFRVTKFQTDSRNESDFMVAKFQIDLGMFSKCKIRSSWQSWSMEPLAFTPIASPEFQLIGVPLNFLGNGGDALPTTEVYPSAICVLSEDTKALKPHG